MPIQAFAFCRCLAQLGEGLLFQLLQLLRVHPAHRAAQLAGAKCRIAQVAVTDQAPFLIVQALHQLSQKQDIAKVIGLLLFFSNEVQGGPIDAAQAILIFITSYAVIE
jgi:hypothetical protein